METKFIYIYIYIYIYIHIYIYTPIKSKQIQENPPGKSLGKSTEYLFSGI